ncbi:MAG: hypothetical protein E7Z80_01405 [Methanobrevibacter thaueri]|nr:hypothetical protein [Methanobrevibacter thaueri]
MGNREFDFSDLDSLIQEDKFETSNIFNRNYTLEYGLGGCLLDYIGFEKNYKIKAFFEHGISFSDDVKDSMRVHESLPSIMSSNFRQNVILSQKNNNGAYAIGPYIAYAKSLLTDEEIQNEKKRLGKNLLIFPAHSTQLSQVEFDFNGFCKNISDIGKDFDTIRVCLYWKDIKNGFNEIYEDYGFDVVTAGHINDQLFLHRLRSLIEIADVTMSNQIGSHVGFCFHLNKPHYLIKTENIVYKPSNSSNVTKIRFGQEKKLSNQDELDYMKFLLTQHNADYDKLMPLLDKYFGLTNVKSKEELQDIFRECEKNYSNLKFYFGFFKLAKKYFSSLFGYFSNK